MVSKNARKIKCREMDETAWKND